MNTQTQKYVRLLAAAVIAAFIVNVTFADDLNPAAYLGDPLSVHAHWKLIPGTVFLDLVDFSTVDDSDPATTLDPLPPSGLVEPVSDPTGTSKAYQFDLPNWVDDLPVKYMRIQLTWAFSPIPPDIVGLSGIDSSGPVVVNSVFSSPVLPGTDPTTLYQFHDFELYPNPDAERWLVVQPDNAQLVQVVVDTVSTVPEPATLSLLGAGGVLLRRRRRS